MRVFLHIFLFAFTIASVYIFFYYFMEPYYNAIFKNAREISEQHKRIELLPMKKDEIKNLENRQIEVKVVSYTQEGRSAPKKNNSSTSLKKDEDEDIVIRTSSDPDRSEAAKLDESFLRFGTHYYKIFQDRVSWNEARKKCEAMGAYLACIETQEENVFLYNHLKTLDGAFFIGAFFYDNKWRWVNSNLFIYTNWGRKQTMNKNTEYHIVFSPLGGEDKWFCVENSTAAGFICEWNEIPDIETDDDDY